VGEGLVRLIGPGRLLAILVVPPEALYDVIDRILDGWNAIPIFVWKEEAGGVSVRQIERVLANTNKLPDDVRREAKAGKIDIAAWIFSIKIYWIVMKYCDRVPIFN
jgi:hypothetical protein